MNKPVGQRRVKKSPQRTCVGCRQQKDQKALIRLVRSADGELMVDHPHKLGGRGAYVCGSIGCLTNALHSKRLSTAVGGPVCPSPPPFVAGQIEERVSRRVLGLLAAANLSKKVAIGARDAASSLHQGSKGSLVVVAEDVSPRVRRSLEDAARRVGVDVMTFGDREELGIAFARSMVGAIALTDPGIAMAVRQELALLHGFTAELHLKTTSDEEGEALERAT